MLNKLASGAGEGGPYFLCNDTDICNKVILHIKGIYWCYALPVLWFSELKVDSFAQINLTVTGTFIHSNFEVNFKICVVHNCRGNFPLCPFSLFLQELFAFQNKLP